MGFYGFLWVLLWVLMGPYGFLRVNDETLKI